MWAAAETHNDTMKLRCNQKATEWDVKRALMVWKRRHYRIKGAKSAKLDVTVLNDWILHYRHYLLLDVQGIPYNSWDKPQYRKWLSNTDFDFLLQCLGGGNNLLDGKCICLMCGCCKRSWVHVTAECPNRPTECPSLHALTLSKEDCKQQVALLRSLAQRFNPDTDKDLRGRTVKVLEKEITTQYVTKMFTNYSYRTMNVDTGEVRTTLQLQKLNNEGKVYVLNN